MKKIRMMKTKRLLNMRGSQAVVLPKEWCSMIGVGIAVELELDAQRQRIIITASSESR